MRFWLIGIHCMKSLNFLWGIMNIFSRFPSGWFGGVFITIPFNQILEFVLLKSAIQDPTNSVFNFVIYFGWWWRVWIAIRDKARCHRFQQ